VLSSSRVGLDIDTPEDLQQLAQAAGEKQSQLLAREFLRMSRPLVLEKIQNSQLAAKS
jgi:2-phospho-L-lactate guanylyltransferase (CobY/MobA/RfbA family)